MPDTTPELAWWVMTGAIAGLLSLITIMMGIICYLLRWGFEKIMAKIDATQAGEYATAKLLGETRVACDVRHDRVDNDIAELKEAVFARRKNDKLTA